MSWTIGNYALSQVQMNANAVEVYKYFSGRGWSLNAIAGILGNMQSESYVNPGVWQSLKKGIIPADSVGPMDTGDKLYQLGNGERIFNYGSERAVILD